MKSCTLALLIASLTVVGCKSTEEHHHRHDTAAPEMKPASKDPRTLANPASPEKFVSAGAPMTVTSAPVPVSAVLAAPEKYAGQPIKIEGQVSAVCEKKGCWARLTDSRTPKGQDLFVKFDCPADESGRILPMSVQGNNAIVEGIVTVGEISEAKARHYAIDGGMSAAEAARIVGPQKQVTVASPAVRVAVPN